ncbi:hypothetical protein [Kitasatospora sp. KL5]|uniref:hypothetical protein n=1 Tax=Kitasatospora sp. KL5 TaxID=3425125 RepID=UPI003D6F71CE
MDAVHGVRAARVFRFAALLRRGDTSGAWGSVPGQDDPATAELARVRAALELNAGSAVRAVEVLLAVDGAGSAVLTEAFHAAQSAGEPDLIERVRARVRATLPAASGTLAALADLYGGEPVTASPLDGAARDCGVLFSERFLAAHAAHVLADHETARELADLLLAHCRSHGLLGWQATCLHLLAETHLALGALEPAARTASEGLRIARYAGLDHRACYLRTTLAACAALEGDEARCRELAEAALAHAGRHDLGTATAHAHRALALSHLGAGDPAPALVHLDQADRHPAGPPVLIAFLLPDLVEAAARTGTTRAGAAERVARWADRSGLPPPSPWRPAAAPSAPRTRRPKTCSPRPSSTASARAAAWSSPGPGCCTASGSAADVAGPAHGASCGRPWSPSRRPGPGPGRNEPVPSSAAPAR